MGGKVSSEADQSSGYAFTRSVSGPGKAAILTKQASNRTAYATTTTNDSSTYNYISYDNNIASQPLPLANTSRLCAQEKSDNKSVQTILQLGDSHSTIATAAAPETRIEDPTTTTTTTLITTNLVPDQQKQGDNGWTMVSNNTTTTASDKSLTVEVPEKEEMEKGKYERRNDDEDAKLRQESQDVTEHFSGLAPVATAAAAAAVAIHEIHEDYCTAKPFQSMQSRGAVVDHEEEEEQEEGSTIIINNYSNSNRNDNSDENYVERIEKLLAFNDTNSDKHGNPTVTPEVVAFFEKQGIYELLMSYITRVGGEDEDEQDQEGLREQKQHDINNNDAVINTNSNKRQDDNEAAEEPPPPPGPVVPAYIVRSYNAMDIITSPMSSDFHESIDRNLERIVLSLFRAFDRRSRCNSFHYFRVFEFVVETYGAGRVAEILMQHESLMDDIVDNIGSPIVSGTIHNLIFCDYGHEDDNGTKAKLAFHKYLANTRCLLSCILHRIVELSLNPTMEDECANAADTFVRIIKELSVDRIGFMMLKGLARDIEDNDSLIGDLFTVIGNNDDENKFSYECRRCCAHVALEMLRISDPLQDPAPGSEKKNLAMTRQALFSLHAAIMKHLSSADYSTLICDLIIGGTQEQQNNNSNNDNDDINNNSATNSNGAAAAAAVKLNAYTVSPPFTTLRLSFVHLLQFCIFNNNNNNSDNTTTTTTTTTTSEEEEHYRHNHHILKHEKMPMVWATLIKWFFEYRFNNMYHNTFCKMFCRLVQQQHNSSINKYDYSLIALLQTNKFLDHLQAALTQDNSNDGYCWTENRGHVIMMLDALHQSSRVLPSDHPLNQFLQGARWQQFLPTLMQAIPKNPYNSDDDSTDGDTSTGTNYSTDGDTDSDEEEEGGEEGSTLKEEEEEEEEDGDDDNHVGVGEEEEEDDNQHHDWRIDTEEAINDGDDRNHNNDEGKKGREQFFKPAHHHHKSHHHHHRFYDDEDLIIAPAAAEMQDLTISEVVDDEKQHQQQHEEEKD